MCWMVLYIIYDRSMVSVSFYRMKSCVALSICSSIPFKISLEGHRWPLNIAYQSFTVASSEPVSNCPSLWGFQQSPYLTEDSVNHTYV